MINKIKQEIKTVYIVDFLRFQTSIFQFFFNISPDFYFLRVWNALLLKLGGCQIDVYHSYIRKTLKCDILNKLKLGSNIFINRELIIEGTGNIEIGNNCQIGPRVTFTTTNHIDHKKDITCNIKIGNNVWIGAGVIITPGVEICDNVSIAAGTVVTRNIKDGSLWGGVPARKLR